MVNQTDGKSLAVRVNLLREKYFFEFLMMNVTAHSIMEDDLRVIPLKEIVKDWLLICVSIIAIGKSKNH